MTLRPEYSLGQSESNAFLFFAVGEENPVCRRPPEESVVLRRIFWR
jgi:hypothetical protein